MPSVFDFFTAQGLTPALLREVSQHQIGLLRDRIAGFDLDPALLKVDIDTPLTAVGGFVALATPRARQICAALAAEGVRTDARGSWLRLGPAPYLCDDQLREAADILAAVCRSL